MPKPNFIFFDTETSGGRGLADILTIDALYYDYNFNLIGEFSCKARLRKSRVYEVDAFMVKLPALALDHVGELRIGTNVTSQYPDPALVLSILTT